jgi:hypothetical protein
MPLDFIHSLVRLLRRFQQQSNDVCCLCCLRQRKFSSLNSVLRNFQNVDHNP